jgi:hypothetical protein
MPLTKIQSLGITDGTIVNADINASAAIDASKLTGISAGIIQIKQTVKTDTFSSSSSSFTDITGMSVSITPTLSTSKILVVVDARAGGNSTGTPTRYKLLRDSTDIYIGDADGSRSRAFSMWSVADGAGYAVGQISTFFIDNPATTSAITYKIQMGTDGSISYINRDGTANNNSSYARMASSITVIELAVGIL